MQKYGTIRKEVLGSILYRLVRTPLIKSKEDTVKLRLKA